MAGVADMPIHLSLASSAQPSDRERACIELLYSQALTTEWVATKVATLLPDAARAQDLHTTIAMSRRGVEWTHGLFIQV